MPTEHANAFASFADAFRTLNAETVELVTPALFAFADEAGADFWDEALAFAQELLDKYVESPIKRAEREVFQEYFYFLDVAAKKLIKAGDLPEMSSGVTAAPLALVPRSVYADQHWTALHAKANLPADVMNAVDAAKNRNRLVVTVLETLFVFLQKVCRPKAFEWQLSLCADRDNPLDPDVAREMLRAWQHEPDLPVAILRQACVWSEDGCAYQYWPTVGQEADKLLRRACLGMWLEEQESDGKNIRALQRLAPFTDDVRMMRWLKNTIAEFGVRVDFFVSQHTAMAKIDDAEEREWRQDALFQEVMGLHQQWPPLLLLADLILMMPGGAHEFALAMFGFGTEQKQAWRLKLEEKSRGIIRRFFLNDARQGRPPSETIQRLCFDDEALYELVMQEVDSVTGQFDSLEQRELVIDKLCGIYSSSREESLLMIEIGQRYRRTMRVLHEDSLGVALRKEQLAKLADMNELLVNLATIASQSRRYLNVRRNLQKTADDVLAADIDFARQVRGSRVTLARRLIAGSVVGA